MRETTKKQLRDMVIDVRDFDQPSAPCPAGNGSAWRSLASATSARRSSPASSPSRWDILHEDASYSGFDGLALAAENLRAAAGKVQRTVRQQSRFLKETDTEGVVS